MDFNVFLWSCSLIYLRINPYDIWVLIIYYADNYYLKTRRVYNPSLLNMEPTTVKYHISYLYYNCSGSLPISFSKSWKGKYV